jgi:electron transfer flavoprotein beta subunit
MKEDGTVNRAALPAVFNPDDLHALEAALDIRDQHGGTVTVLTMGPLGATEVLRACLFRGADRAIIINDRRAAGSDTLATSYILSQAVRKIGNYDFVFCGRQAIDGDTAQVGPQLAEKLGLPQVTCFERLLELSDQPAVVGRTVRVRRNVGNGWEVIEARLPLLLTVLDTANRPRPAAARRVMQYKRARSTAEVAREVSAVFTDASADERAGEQANRLEMLKARNLLIDQWDLDDLEADLQWCGITGSPTKVHRVQSIVLTKEGHTEVPPTQEGILNMIRELIVDHTLG